VSRIVPDPFWDGTAGGGVRCSSTGEDASRYLDPSRQSMEGNGGRSIGSLLPGSHGLRGVVIPRATALGGSRGFDPHKPRLVNIDPDIKGQSCVVDMSKITKESMDEAFLEAAQNPLAQTDIRLLAAQTYHNLAVGYQPIESGQPGGTRRVARRAPNSLNSYVVPRAGLGGGQIIDEEEDEPEVSSEQLMSPSVSPRTPVGLTKLAERPFRLKENPTNMQPTTGLKAPPVRMVDEYGVEVVDEAPELEMIEQPKAKPAFRDQSTKPAPARRVSISGPPVQQQALPAMANGVPPNTNVTFEMKGWGTFSAAYHEVIKNDCLLVLVYDTRFKGGMKFFPQTTDNTIAVSIEGNPNVFFVNSYGNRFEHAGYEYCILVIDQENSAEAPQEAT
jgi:hypothetical protein